MRQLGLGVMIGQLAGNRTTYEAWQKSKDKTIASVVLEANGDGALLLTFVDNTWLRVRDAGRSCCEARFMTCDDDLTDFVGAVLMDIDTSEGESKEGKHGDCNETMFLLVKTSKGVINCCTHNKHNGYYGGFHMVLEAGEAQ